MHPLHHTPEYKRAFTRYLRRGVPIDVSLKAEAAVFPTQYYIWRTQEDERVRESHAANNRRIFAWNKPPPTGHPGEAPGCRCRAEPVHLPYDPPIESVYLLEELIAILLGGGVVRRVGQEVLRGAFDDAVAPAPQPPPKPAGPPPAPKPPPKLEPKMNDTKTWPKPPGQGRLKEAAPSRTKPRSRGEKSLYDEKGGEWRYAPEDKYHNPHWDYKPSGNGQEWKNIPIDGKPILK